MHVVATAGHVDHGKSTLVKALTGQEPDRLEEERRRGLSIELGYAWTSLPDLGSVAFVDVPGHEKFLRTMLAGVGAVPAVLLVVAADDPWMPQAAEHLAALSALGVSHGVVAVTRSDLAEPAPMVARAREELSRTPLAGAPVLPVSAVTGEGLDRLRDALVAMVAALPDPSPEADVRLWLDRAFHVRGAGTVVTGTLPAGTVAVGHALAVGDAQVRVRGIQALGADRSSVSGVARVALNVVPDDRTALARDSVLVTPGAWHQTSVVDVRLTDRMYGEGAGEPPERPVLHVGGVAVPVRYRRLGTSCARLSLDRELPLRIGDRAVLRDPGSRRLWGVAVVDPAPPRLRRRGAAAARARSLETATCGLESELARRGVASADLLRRIGVPVPDGRATWLIGDQAAAQLRNRLASVVRRHDEANPLAPGIAVPVLARILGLPSADLVPRLVGPPLRVVDGKVTTTPSGVGLPAHLERAVEAVVADLADEPFAAPTADRLAQLGLHRRAVGAAAKAGRLLDVGSGVVLRPGADEQAASWLADLAQPFTTSEARQRLGTSRRVVLPLLAHLDRIGVTVRHPDDTRSLR